MTSEDEKQREGLLTVDSRTGRAAEVEDEAEAEATTEGATEELTEDKTAERTVLTDGVITEPMERSVTVVPAELLSPTTPR